MIDRLLVIRIDRQSSAAVLDCFLNLSEFEVYRAEEIVSGEHPGLDLERAVRFSDHLIELGAPLRLALALQRLGKQVMRIGFGGMRLDSGAKAGDRPGDIVLLRLHDAFGGTKKMELRINAAGGPKVCGCPAELPKLGEKNSPHQV